MNKRLTIDFSTILEQAKDDKPSTLSALHDLYAKRLSEFILSKGIEDTNNFVERVIEKSYGYLNDFKGLETDFTYIVCRIACENIRTNYPWTALKITQTQEHVIVLRVFFGLTKQQTADAMQLDLKQVNTIEDLTRTNLEEYISNKLSNPVQEVEPVPVELEVELEEEEEDPPTHYEESEFVAEETKIIPVVESHVEELEAFNQVPSPDQDLETLEEDTNSKKTMLLIMCSLILLFGIGSIIYFLSDGDETLSAQSPETTTTTTIPNRNDIQPLITDELPVGDEEQEEDLEETDTDIEEEPNTTPPTTPVQPITITFSGSVRQSSGNPARNVEINLTKNGVSFKTRTNSSGAYTFSNIEEGCYQRTTSVSANSETICLENGNTSSQIINVGVLTAPPIKCEVQLSRDLANAGVEIHSIVPFEENYEFRDINQKVVAETQNMGDQYDTSAAEPNEREYNANWNRFNLGSVYYVAATNQYGTSQAKLCERN